MGEEELEYLRVLGGGEGQGEDGLERRERRFCFFKEEQEERFVGLPQGGEDGLGGEDIILLFEVGEDPAREGESERLAWTDGDSGRGPEANGRFEEAREGEDGLGRAGGEGGEEELVGGLDGKLAEVGRPGPMDGLNARNITEG